MTDQHFTAWLTTDRSCLDQDNCDISILADDITTVVTRDSSGDEIEKPEYSSTGDPVFYAITGVNARTGSNEDAIRDAERILTDAGWSIEGLWGANSTGYIATVTRN